MLATLRQANTYSRLYRYLYTCTLLWVWWGKRLLSKTLLSSMAFIVLPATVVIHRYVPDKMLISGSSKGRLLQFSVKISDAGAVQDVLKAEWCTTRVGGVFGWFWKPGREHELSFPSLRLLMFSITLRSKLWETCITCRTRTNKATCVEWKAKETRGCVFQMKKYFKSLFTS